MPRSAATSSATGPTVTALTAILDGLEAGQPALDAAVAGLPALGARLAGLPDDLQDQVEATIFTLAPSGSFPIRFPGPGVLEAVDPAITKAVDDVLSPVVGWLQDVLAKLDLSAIQDPIRSVADTVTEAAEAFERSLTELTSQVQGLFDEVRSIVHEVDLQAIVQQVTQAIEGFGHDIGEQLSGLFEPVKGAVGMSCTRSTRPSTGSTRRTWCRA